MNPPLPFVLLTLESASPVEDFSFGKVALEKECGKATGVHSTPLSIEPFSNKPQLHLKRNLNLYTPAACTNSRVVISMCAFINFLIPRCDKNRSTYCHS